MPDMDEGYVGKLTAPFCRYTDTATECTELVADVEPEVEAGVGEFPHTVDTMGTVGFSKNILKAHLKEEGVI